MHSELKKFVYQYFKLFLILILRFLTIKIHNIFATLTGPKNLVRIEETTINHFLVSEFVYIINTKKKN